MWAFFLCIMSLLMALSCIFGMTAWRHYDSLSQKSQIDKCTMNPLDKLILETLERIERKLDEQENKRRK
jgi:hypothetical protein